MDLNVFFKSLWMWHFMASHHNPLTMVFSKCCKCFLLLCFHCPAFQLAGFQKHNHQSCQFVFLCLNGGFSTFWDAFGISGNKNNSEISHTLCLFLPSFNTQMLWLASYLTPLFAGTVTLVFVNIVAIAENKPLLHMMTVNCFTEFNHKTNLQQRLTDANDCQCHQFWISGLDQQHFLILDWQQHIHCTPKVDCEILANAVLQVGLRSMTWLMLWSRVSISQQLSHGHHLHFNILTWSLSIEQWSKLRHFSSCSGLAARCTSPIHLKSIGTLCHNQGPS